MARPKIEIDWETVRKLCAMQCTGEEIASFLNINYDTLQRAVKREHKMSFADYFKKHSANGKISLRRKQYEVATSGSVPMLIWLGKQYLDQKDKQELGGDPNNPIQTTTVHATQEQVDEALKRAQEMY